MRNKLLLTLSIMLLLVPFSVYAQEEPLPPSPTVPVSSIGANSHFQPVSISRGSKVMPATAGFTIDSPIKPFGPSYSGGQQGRARSTMFFSHITYFKTGEAKTWLNVAAPGPYAVCAKVDSYTINGVFKGSTTETCENRSDTSETKASVGNGDLCTWNVTYTFATSSQHRITSSGGTSWNSNTNVSGNVTCSN